MRPLALLPLLLGTAAACSRGASPHADQNAGPVYTTVAEVSSQAAALRGRSVILRCRLGPSPVGPPGALVATDTRVAVVPLLPVRFSTPAVQEAARTSFPEAFVPAGSRSAGSGPQGFSAQVPHCVLGTVEGFHLVIHELWPASESDGCRAHKPNAAEHLIAADSSSVAALLPLRR